MIASALIVIQQTEVTCPKVKQIRETYKKSISDKHEDSIAKFGSILAQGIIDAGKDFSYFPMIVFYLLWWNFGSYDWVHLKYAEMCWPLKW